MTLLHWVIFVSEKGVKQMCEERKQMLQKISDNDEKWERAEEEVTQVVSRHSVIQAELEEQEQLTFAEKERARVSGNICIMLMGYSVKCETTSSLYALSVLYRQRLKTWGKTWQVRGLPWNNLRYIYEVFQM